MATDPTPHPLAGEVLSVRLLEDAGWPGELIAGHPYTREERAEMEEFLRRRFDEGWRPEGWFGR